MKLTESKVHFVRHYPSKSELKQRNNELDRNTSCLLEILKGVHVESKIFNNVYKIYNFTFIK